MSESPKAYRRSNYFIEKKFQADFILKFCLLVVFGGLVTIGLVYLLASRATTVSIINARVVVRSASDFILPVLAQTVAVVVILVGSATIFMTLFVSHRIAGPLYRFKKVMESLEQGDFSGPFSIRDLDQLKILADALNSVVVNNREHLAALKDTFASLEGKFDVLAQNVSDEQRARVNEARALFLDAKKKLDHFKTA